MPKIIHTDPSIRVISPSVPLDPAAWFGNAPYVLATLPTMPQTFEISFDLFIPTSMIGTFTNGIFSLGAAYATHGMLIYLRNNGLSLITALGNVSLSFLSHYGATASITIVKTETLLSLAINATTNQIAISGTLPYYNNSVGIGVRYDGGAPSWKLTGMMRHVSIAGLHYWPGDGIAESNWADQTDSANGDISGVLERCYVLPNGGVLKDGVLM